MRLLDSLFKDFYWETMDLHIHLKRSHTFSRTSYLKVHIASKILCIHQICQHICLIDIVSSNILTLLDIHHQPHRYTRHWPLQRHTGIHQRETTRTGRGHAGRTILRHDFRYRTNCIWEFLLSRKYWHQRTLSKISMPDFTAPRRTKSSYLTDSIGWCIIMMHITTLAICHFHRID